MKPFDLSIRREIYILADTLVYSLGKPFFDKVKGDFNKVDEWVLVSDWLFERLEKVGAIRADYLGLFFWGRKSRGMFSIDEDLLDVSELLVLEGLHEKT